MAAVLRELSRNVTVRADNPIITLSDLPDMVITEHIATPDATGISPTILQGIFSGDNYNNGIQEQPINPEIGYDLYVCIVTRHDLRYHVTSHVRRGYSSAYSTVQHANPFGHAVIFGIQGTIAPQGRRIGVIPVSDSGMFDETMMNTNVRHRGLELIPTTSIRKSFEVYMTTMPLQIREAIKGHVTSLFVQTIMGDNPVFSTTTVSY
jgi:hypothetical protein